MQERLDKILTQLVDLVETHTQEAVDTNMFSKDLAEAMCIVLSLSYGRWGSGSKQPD